MGLSVVPCVLSVRHAKWSDLLQVQISMFQFRGRVCLLCLALHWLQIIIPPRLAELTWPVCSVFVSLCSFVRPVVLWAGWFRNKHRRSHLALVTFRRSHLALVTSRRSHLAIVTSRRSHLALVTSRRSHLALVTSRRSHLARAYNVWFDVRYRARQLSYSHDQGVTYKSD